MSGAARTPIGADAIAAKGWLGAHQWLLLRRASQLGILALFAAGPWFGLWIVKGNLSASMTLDVLPLTDPLLLLHSLLGGLRTGNPWPPLVAFTGAAIVLALYLLVGGRAFCAWTCPVNLVTDAAAWLRRRLHLGGGAHLSRSTRWWLLGLSLALTVATGTIAWEMVNPVSMLHRGLFFGLGAGALVIAAIFFFDLFVVRHGWCGHLCPVGAFYGLIGRASLLRVRLPAREACNNCLDCFAVCPEHQVIRAPLKGVAGAAPVILSSACTNCGRCIDVCSKDVFAFGTRFPVRVTSEPTAVAPPRP